MDLKEFYEKIGGDYNAVVSRLCNESFVQKYVIKFSQDKSFDMLCDAMQNNDAKAAFMAAHTIKGIGINLDFTRLYESASELTELLRDGNMPDDSSAFDKVSECYNDIIEAIRELQ